ncbi:peptidase domain-containing ABC transporter [Kangiella geojedonensis]|uniref:ABC transporter ATP-binding protein n=1 Tax=Kangiella geojedonensis TaxID=914150 RepID=A0A0F6TRW9_9GAMM|nr:peptidase domain-containing ABC transporter [Kangiella geojedonensis]AKE52930.1 ABC transporter ATP-binding protein [Kangiella geojedonensis]
MISISSLLKFKNKSSLPVVLQTEIAECGLACVSMVATFYGYCIDLNSLRANYSSSLKGQTLKGIINIFDYIGMAARAVRLEIDELKQLKTPCILHWDLNHFVVLESVTKKGIVIHDPATGRRELSFEIVSKHFTGVAVEIKPSSSFTKKKITKKTNISDLWSSIRGLRPAMLKILLFSVALQLISLLSPLYMQLVIDEVLINQDYQLLSILAIGFGFLVILKVLIAAVRGLVILFLGSQLSAEMASNLFRHLLRLPMKYFESRHIGDVISRFGSIDYIKNLLTTGVIEVLVDGFLAVGLIIVMYFYSPLLSTLVLIISFIYLLIRLSLYRRYRQLNEELLVLDAKEESNFMESVKGVQSIKLFGKEAERHSVWQNHFAESINSGIKLGRFNITFSFIKSSIFGIENIIIIYIAALEVMSAAMTIGMLYTYMSYKGQFIEKIGALVEKLIQFKMLSLHLERLGDITQTDAEFNLEKLGGEIQNDSGELALDNVSFKYSEHDNFIFKDINLRIRKGESIAIVGASGSGKTTLMKVMLGLLQPETGEVRSSGININHLGLKQYRMSIGSVMQDDQLFSGCIADNISFFDPNIDRSKVESCAKRAFIHDDIIKMPMSYYSYIGDMGSNLSGGQKQRVLLARALYNNPSILFLDEATSSLDVDLERKVNDTVKALNITRIIIAHRPQTISMADRVLELRDNRLFELTNL